MGNLLIGEKMEHNKEVYRIIYNLGKKYYKKLSINNNKKNNT